MKLGEISNKVQKSYLFLRGDLKESRLVSSTKSLLTGVMRWLWVQEVTSLWVQEVTSLWVQEVTSDGAVCGSGSCSDEPSSWQASPSPVSMGVTVSQWSNDNKHNTTMDTNDIIASK